MKLIFFILQIALLMFYPFHNFAQDAPTMSGVPRQYQSTLYTFQKVKKLLNNQEKEFSIPFEDIKGSPYLNKNFTKGKLYINDSLIEENYFRYNIYSDEIEINENGQLFGLLKIPQTKLILDEKVIALKNFENNKSYFLVIYDQNNITLIQRKRCKLTPAQKASTPNQMDRAAKFTIYEDYYIKMNKNESFRELKLNKKSILKALYDKKKQIQAFLKNEEIDLDNESDVLRVLEFYASID